MANDIAHQASAVIARDAETVFRFMSDPQKLHRWSFGTWQTEIAEDGLVTGTSIFDGSRIFVRIAADRRQLSIDYHLGQQPEALIPRIMVRIVPGRNLGAAENSCVLTFLAWRAEGMTGERWHRLTVSHEFEVVLIKNILESGNA
jgi:hypothetical protein